MKNTTLKEFARYASLNILAMVGLSCYILADTFFVSMGLGATGLAALNLAIPIMSFISGTGLMLGMGGATKYSILSSQGNNDEGNRVFSSTVSIAFCFALIYFLCGLFLSDKITLLLGADQEVFEMSKTYLQVLLLFSPFFLLNNVLVCFVRNDGAPGTSMVAMISGSLSNILLDYIFIFPLKMGIFGAVLATGFAPIISMLILSVHFIKKKNKFHLKAPKMFLKYAANIFKTGFPSLVAEVSSGIVIIVFNLLIFGISGNTAVAAYGIIANLSLVVISIFTGISQGVQPLISTAYGKGDKKLSSVYFRYALTTSLVLSVLIYLGLFFGAEWVAGIFNSENNSVLQEIAVQGLRIYFTGSVFAGINIISCVYLSTTENAGMANILSSLRGFILIISLSFILTSLIGIVGLWSAFPLAELLTTLLSAIFIIRVIKKQGQQN